MPEKSIARSVRADRMSRTLPRRPRFRTTSRKSGIAKQPTGKCSVTWAETRGQEDVVQKAVKLWIH